MTISEEQLEAEIPILEIIGNLLLFFLVFGMAATVDLGSVEEQLTNKGALIIGVVLQFIILPFLGFAAVKLLQMNEAMGITLLVITSSPGGSYSNWWCSLFNSDLALSITMTTISTIISIFALPLNLLLYASLTFNSKILENLNWTALIISICIVISANFLGLYFAANVEWPGFQSTAYKVGNLAGIGLVIFTASITTSEEEVNLLKRSWSFFFGVAFPCIFGLFLSIAISSYFDLAKPERVSVTIECCYQNVGIASSVALAMFKGPNLAEALGVPLYYGMVEAITVCIFCILSWKLGWTKAPSDDSLYTIITKSYEMQIEAPPKDIYEIIP